MGTFTSFDYTLLVTDELVNEILALGDKVEIAYPEKLRMKLFQKIGRIRNRYMVIQFQQKYDCNLVTDSKYNHF